MKHIAHQIRTIAATIRPGMDQVDMALVVAQLNILTKKLANELPMQPVAEVKATVRFVQNTCVRSLLDHSTKNGFGLNELAMEEHTPEHRMQFAQLIGYSVNGYRTLSYVSDESLEAADEIAHLPL